MPNQSVAALKSANCHFATFKKNGVKKVPKNGVKKLRQKWRQTP
jgi:hypothetical protein